MPNPGRILLFAIGLILMYRLGEVMPRQSKGFTGSFQDGAKSIHCWDIRPKHIKNVPVPRKIQSEERHGNEIVRAHPQIVKGIYLSAWSTGKTSFLKEMTAFARKTGFNGVVVDVKDDTGKIGYASDVPLAKKVGAISMRYKPVQVMRILREARLYPIARIVVFKDPLMASKKPDWAVKDRRGGIWKDRKGMSWVDPFNQDVWQYNLDVAKEAARLGFREIQFDYVRFVSDGAIRECRYTKEDTRTKAEVLRDFLAYAHRELSALGVMLSVDVFGLACTTLDDLGIGQKFTEIAANVDVICPMVYPSHYRLGSYDLADPEAKPYETVYHSLRDAVKKCAGMSKQVIIRPWLQDFSLKHPCDQEYLKAQVMAVCDAKLEGWMFWNPANVYDEEKYQFHRKLPF